MHELSPENLADYLWRTGRVATRHARVEALSWGVSNAVFRVQAGQELMVVKQSRPRLRTREDWFSDVARIFGEAAAMRLLEPRLPPGVVPRILFEDRENYCFAMTHAPIEARTWKELLLTGVADERIARHAGTVLGTIHESTARLPRDGMSVHLTSRTVFDQLRIDPFYRRVQERRPEVAADVEPLVRQMLERDEALCHGDFSPKNLLVLTDRPPVEAGAFTLVDYETAHFGDHAMDIGFFLSHLMLKAVKHHRRRGPLLALTRAFWAGYGDVVSQWPLEELTYRGVQHLGACTLARIDGTSPVDYLADEALREAARQFARQLLWRKPLTWDQVLAILDEALQPIDASAAGG